MGEQAERLARGQWYLDDDELRERRHECWRRLDVFNAARGDDDAGRAAAMAELVGSIGVNVVVVPRFTCTYGSNIHFGDSVFVNGNAFFMDDAPITIESHIRIGPGAQVMTALHPVDDHKRRRDGWERAAPIVIGDNSWLGASVTVGAGVTIGRNAVIGAGSVVLRDIPDHVIAAGVPARIIRSTPTELSVPEQVEE